jgi:hypothetical protein
MPQDIRQNLVNTRPREVSGAATSDKYEFQKNWALCELIDRHESGGDYCLIMEHHEDVVVLNSEDAPTEADFIQIKTKSSGYWTLAPLLKREPGESGPKLSMLGKLVRNKIVFSFARRLLFVSNASFQVPLKAGGDSKASALIQLADLDAKERRRIAKQLGQEHPGLKGRAYEKITLLGQANLPLRDHDIHTRGRVATYLEQRFPGTAFPVLVIHRHLLAEVRRRNNYQGECKTIGDLMKHKAISRRQFEAMIGDTLKSLAAPNLWQIAREQLVSEQFPLRERLALESSKTQYEIEVLDDANVVIGTYRRDLRRILSEMPSVANEDTRLSSVITYCSERIKAKYLAFTREKGMPYVHASIILEFLAVETGSGLSPIDPQSASEAA